MKRKYIIPSNPELYIEDDGHWLSASWRNNPTSSGSIGVKRPRIGPLPNEFKALFNLSGCLFYLTDFTSPQGFWLSVATFSSPELAKAGMSEGLFGKAYCQFVATERGDLRDIYYRQVYHFTGWSIKHEEKERLLPFDDMTKDYLTLSRNSEVEAEERFNAAIAFSGKNLDWISEKLGPWVPVTELPPVVLK